MPSDPTPTPTLTPPALPAYSPDPACLSTSARLTVRVDTDRLTIHPEPASSKYRADAFVLVARWDVDTDMKVPLDVNAAAVQSFVRFDLSAYSSPVVLDALTDAVADGSGTVELSCGPHVEGEPWVIWTVRHTPDDN
jgi:hypothetical protein